LHQATAKQTALNTAAVVAVLAGAYLLWRIRYILILFFVAILVAAAIEPLMFRLRRIGARRSHSVLAIYIVIVAAVTVFIIFLQQALVGEFDRFYTSIPDLLERARQWAASIRNDFLRETTVAAVESMVSMQPQSDELGKEAYTVTVTILESVAAVITVFVVCYYWIAERGLLKRLVLFLAPRHRKDQVTMVWDNIEQKLGMWFRAQVILCLVVGVASGVGYFFLGVKYALLLGVIAAVTELIPVAGPFLGAIPALGIAVAQGGVKLAIMVGLWAMLVQFAENNILVPRIMGKNTGITPLAVIFAMLVGYALMGIVGALLAVPTAAVVNALIEDLVIREKVEGAPKPVEIIAESAVEGPPESPEEPPKIIRP
jgi:predicted PurR-regulated permease PerM